MSLRPLLLLLDGHSTHYQPEVVRYASENNIIMLCLPPHTTHETQPLDCGVFSPLKTHWTTVCHDYMQKNPGKVINKYNFNLLFSEAWLRAVIPSNIISGFRTCGVYPFNPSAVSVVACDNFMPQGSSTAQMEEEDTPSIISGGDSGSSPHISDEQEELYRRRFEEGYDLEDAEYTRWLRRTHPELQSNALQDSSLADFFPEVEPQRALEVVDEATPTSSKRMLSYTSPPSSSSTPNSDTSLSKFLTSPHLSSDTPASSKK